MLKQLSIQTSSHSELINITSQVQNVVSNSGVKSGIVVVFIPHTTASVTINENADPDVKRDLVYAMNRTVPNEGFNHYEGNSDAHTKCSMFGFSETIIIEGGKLLLGTWQGIYFSEFDGPRSRKIYVKIIKDN